MVNYFLIWHSYWTQKNWFGLLRFQYVVLFLNCRVSMLHLCGQWKLWNYVCFFVVRDGNAKEENCSNYTYAFCLYKSSCRLNAFKWQVNTDLFWIVLRNSGLKPWLVLWSCLLLTLGIGYPAQAFRNGADYVCSCSGFPLSSLI